MVTDLIWVASGVSPAVVLAAVPPGCRRSPEPAPAPRSDPDGVVVEMGPWRPRCAARHLLPSLSALTPAHPTFRFELSVRLDGSWTPWVAMAPLGERGFAPAPGPPSPLTVDVDVAEVSRPVEAVRLRLRVHREDAGAMLSMPWLLTLSACDLAATEPVRDLPRHGAALAVPPRSQMAEDPAIASRICSPTSVGMVLAYLGIEDTTARVAADALHRALDRYGVWPAAIAAAARRGALGYLLRFPDWSAAAWCLEQGLPVIASIRYGPDELRGAPMRETTGHLLVVTGHGDGEVLVNDPAAPDADAVRRAYDLDEFCRAWLAGSGIGYVLFRPPAGPTPGS